MNSKSMSFYISKLKVMLQENTKWIYIFVLIFIFFFVLIILPPSFAAPIPVDRIEIYSEKSNYDNGDPGAWKIMKNAKWISSDTVEVTIDVDTILKKSKRNVDVLLAIDSSNENKLGKVKADAINLIETLLSDGDNRVGLVNFYNSYEAISNLTSNKEGVLKQVELLKSGDSTSYYRALLNLESILKNYVMENGRECLVLFIVGSYPSKDSPNEKLEYSYLKEKYPFITINGIQYEMGETVVDALKHVSDRQYVTNSETLSTILYDVSLASEIYDNFEIADYIDTTNFYIDKNSDIKVDKGTIAVDELEQRVNWHIRGLKTKSKASMTMKLKLKNELLKVPGIYSFNLKTDINSKIGELEEIVETKESLALSNNQHVTYDVNMPDGCSPNGVPDEKDYFVFDTVEISENVPKCSGFQFKRWEIVTDGVSKINKDYFTMPDKDVVIRGTWGKVEVNKAADGTLREALTLYKQVEEDTKNETKFAKKYTGDTSNFLGNENIYYYYGKAADNNVIFANYCWKIVRTTDTGGVKLIYNGVPSNGKCNNTGVASQLTASQMNLSYNTSAFNSKWTSLADVGYMYNLRHDFKSLSLSNVVGAKLYGNNASYSGGIYTLTNTTSVAISNNPTSLVNNHYTCFDPTGRCGTVYYVFYVTDTHIIYLDVSGGKKIENVLNEMLNNNYVNKISSPIKSAVDYWYSRNMTNYTNMLEDTVWCNDRSIGNWSTTGWNPNGGNMKIDLHFKSYENLSNLTCINKNDRFTTDSTNGNGMLVYPVGLITAQEANLAYVSGNSPLSTGSYYWTLSPYNFHTLLVSTVYLVGENGVASSSYSGTNIARGVRPSISLRAGIEYSNGDGSSDNPYVIPTD